MINSSSNSSLSSLTADVRIMLRNFMAPFKEGILFKDIANIFVIEDFGLIVCCMNRADYLQAKDGVSTKFPNWRTTFVTTSDSLLESKYDILWELMRCGYMKWLRYTYPRQVKRVLVGPENLGNRIINERLRIWQDKPKFKYLIEDNKVALKNGVANELTRDPSFFDFMPSEGD